MLKLIEGGGKKEAGESKIHFIQKVIKDETWMVMAQSAVELEDEFSNLYWTATAQNNLFLMPPFEPNVLLNLVQTNNVLNQCIEAMEVNIDGTGHEFVPSEEGKDIDKKEEEIATKFFDEPYPNISMVNIRRKLRRQMESVGYGFIEVLRNIAGDVVGMRSVETAHVRMVKLDLPIQVKKKVERDGKEVELTLWERERRFAQTVALKKHIYYREFGTSREIHRETGAWDTPEAPIPPEMRGSELLILGINPDITTPYFLPRWINQLPSVVGSRAAEEQNLQFLDAGGLPPAIVFIQGGTLIKDTSDQLRMYLSGLNKNKNRAVVVEVQSSSGSLDAAGKVDVKVERFGSAQSQDSMFTNYDEKTEEHVRVGFRLPPIFLGREESYNFATAQTAYMVAEAQVFLPERVEFDELMNKMIIKELKLKTLRFKSKPITLKDVATQLEALKLAGPLATRESYIKELNIAGTMTLELAEVPAQGVGPDNVPLKNTLTADEMDSGKLPASIEEVKAGMKPEPKPEPEKEDTHVVLKPGDEMHPVPKKGQKIMARPRERKAAGDLLALAQDYAIVKGLTPMLALKADQAADQAAIEAAVEALDPDDARAFNSLLAMVAFGSDDADLSSVVGVVRKYSSTQARQPSGSPKGGQFANNPRMGSMTGTTPLPTPPPRSSADWSTGTAQRRFIADLPPSARAAIAESEAMLQAEIEITKERQAREAAQGKHHSEPQDRTPEGVLVNSLEHPVVEKSSSSHELGGGINESLVVEIDGKDYVFKPIDGESGRDEYSTDASMAEREVIASRLDAELRLGLVPPTIMGEVDGRKGSVQDFVQRAMTYGKYLNENGTNDLSRLEMARMAVLDILLVNTDRHSGNAMVDGHGKLWAIDHGFSMGESPTAWSFATDDMQEGDMPRAEQYWLAERIANMDVDRVLEGSTLNPTEIANFNKRRAVVVDHLRDGRLHQIPVSFYYDNEPPSQS